MSKILETNLCKINYSNSLEELSKATVKLLQNKIVEYKKLFKLRNDEKENISNNYMVNDCGKNSGNGQNKNVINLPNEYNSQKYYQ